MDWCWWTLLTCQCVSEAWTGELTPNFPPKRDQIEGCVLDGDDDVDGLSRLAVERLPEPDGAGVPVHAEEVPADGVLHPPALGVSASEVVHLHTQVSSKFSSDHLLTQPMDCTSLNNILYSILIHVPLCRPACLRGLRSRRDPLPRARTAAGPSPSGKGWAGPGAVSPAAAEGGFKR